MVSPSDGAVWYHRVDLRSSRDVEEIFQLEMEGNYDAEIIKKKKKSKSLKNKKVRTDAGREGGREGGNKEQRKNLYRMRPH